MLHLWETMGEKNFRFLEREKVMFVPSKRTLTRLRAKTPRATGFDINSLKMLRKLVCMHVFEYCECTCLNG